METFYVREKKDRRLKPSWIMMRGMSPEAVKRRYVNEANKRLKERFKGNPDLIQRHTMTISDVAVRKTPPTLGDIKSHAQGVWHDEYVPRPKPRTARTGRPTTVDKQFALLVQESQRLRMPTHYSNDLYKHDLKILRRNKPRSFIWIVREHGTHLYPLDTGGKPLSDKEYQQILRSVEYDVKRADRKEVYVVKGTTMESATGSRALGLVELALARLWGTASL